MLKIRAMSKADIKFAVGLTEAENWGNQVADFERLIKIDTQGCFVGYEKEHPIGIITTVDFGQLGFLGNLIVKKEFRGRGYGRCLMQHGFDYLKSKKLKAIELDGDFPAVRLYRKLGFKDKYLSFRLLRNPGGNSPIEKSRTSVPAGQVAEFDEKATGLHRSDFLADYAGLHQEHLYTIKRPGVVAYGIVKVADRGFSTLGPLIADEPTDAETIISTITRNYNALLLGIGVPENNPQAVEILLNYGFYYEVPSLRMYYGERIDYENKICGIIAGDVG